MKSSRYLGLRKSRPLGAASLFPPPLFLSLIFLSWLFLSATVLAAAANTGPLLTNEPGRTLLSCGAQHVLMLKSDGTVWVWGTDSDGQMGGAPELAAFSTLPSRITNILGAVSVAAGDYHSLVLQYDGTVLAFGRNGSGQLGLGNTAQQSLPMLITNLASVAALDAGPDFSMAVLSNGTVKAWGDNSAGKLGFGSTSPSTVKYPTNVLGLTGVSMVSCGYRHALAVTTNGTVWAWGANASGQLGDGTTTARSAPVAVTNVPGVLQVAAGEDCSFALTTNGTVFAWGDWNNGRLGLTNTAIVKSPLQIPALSNICQLRAGSQQGYALDAGGKLWAWGHNGSMAFVHVGFTLGFPSPDIVLTPTQHVGLTSIKFVARSGPKIFSGNSSPRHFSAALYDDGHVRDWGGVTIGSAIAFIGDPATHGPGLTTSNMNWGYNPVAPTAGIDPKAYYRGTGTNADLVSFVIPLDFQQGVQFADYGGLVTNVLPCLTNSAVNYHFNATNLDANGQTNLSLRFPFQNPIAGFGGRVGGTTLFSDRSYGFIVSAGKPSPLNAYPALNNYSNALKIDIYAKTNFAFIGSTNFPIPYYLLTNGSWSSFLTNGLTSELEAFGLKTILSTPEAFAKFVPETMGLTSLDRVGTGTSYGVTNGGVIQLSHIATGIGTNYIFVISLRGHNGKGWASLAQDMNPAWQPIYSVEFEAAPPWSIRFLSQLQFEGEPLPSFYDGKSLEELLSGGWVVTNEVDVSNSPASYTNLDDSPELLRHPILDDFVESMKHDPLSLARFVQNEIELTDALDYPAYSQVTSGKVNLGGVNRSALGTFLERQGSPVEQCALLIYLLRQAGVPAVYAFPPDDGVKMLDARLSKMLRFQIAGAMNSSTYLSNTNVLITVNYPWVAAYLDGKWAHLFPWIKDTEIIEGPNLYDFLPNGYDNATKWVMGYIYNRPEVVSLGSSNDPPGILFPRYVEQQLLTNAPGLSFDELGLRAVNRKRAFNSFNEFPTPTWVAPTNKVAENLSDPFLTSAGFRAWNSNVLAPTVFNTLRISANVKETGALIFDTGELRCCDLNDRRLLIFHDRTTTNANSTTPVRTWLTLAPYRPEITNSMAFTNETTLLSRQALIYTNADNVTGDLLHVVLKRFRPTGNVDQIPRDVPLAKGDLNAICLNFGRVTKQMLEPLAKDVWNMERQIQLDFSITNRLKPEDYHGPLAYLMGMAYYEKVNRFLPDLERLHERSPVTTVSVGLSKLIAQHSNLTQDGLPAGPMVYVQPMVDMVFTGQYSVEAPTSRPDSGEGINFANDAFGILTIADESAKEHDVINGFFKEADAVSTIKLLQLTSQRHATNASNPDIVVVNQADAIPMKPTFLNSWAGDSNIWQAVEAAVMPSPRSQAFLTPGKISNNSGSYSGSGALIIDRIGVYAALISGMANGGFGSILPDDSFMPANLYNVSLRVDWLGNYSVSYAAPGSNYRALAGDSFAGFRAYDVFTTAQNNYYTYTSYNQAWAWQTVGYSLLGSAAQFYDLFSDAVFHSESRGSLGYLTDAIGQRLTELSDPVGAVSGEFYIDSTDLSLVGPLPLDIRRNYSSLNLADNEFGIGWKIGFTPYISVPTNGTVMYAAEPDGSVLAYEPLTNNSFTWAPNLLRNPSLVNNRVDGVGSTANLLLSRIERVADDCTTNYYLYSPNGEIRVYQQRAFPVGNGIDRDRPYLARWTDSRGNTLTFDFGTNQADTDYGELRRIDSSNGGYIRFRYDVYGHIVEAISGDGRNLHYEYDQYGDLVKVVLPDNSAHVYEYQHDTQSVTNGNKVTKEPCSLHLLVRERKPDGRRLANVYDAQRRVTIQASTVGLDLNLVTNAMFVYANDFVLTNSFTNSITGTTWIIDAFGKTNRYDYSKSQITNVVDPLGLSITQEWYPDDATPPGYPRSVKKQKDQRGLVVEYQYDRFGNITNSITTGTLTGIGGIESASEQVVYDTNQLPVIVIDALGDSNVVRYHAAFKFFPEEVVSFKQGQPVVTNRAGYENFTNVVVNGNTTWTNVALGLVRQVVRAWGSSDASTNELFYDGRGFLTNQVDYAGADQLAISNFYSYNGRGELFEARDLAGRRTRYDYDQAGRLKAKEVFEAGATFPLSWQYSYYNQNGDLTWSDGPQFDPEDYVWRDYDGAGRKIVEARWRSQAKADGSGLEPVPGDGLYSISYFTYDPAGNLTNSVEPLGNYRVMAYDALGRMTQQVAYAADSTPLATNFFAYEPGGQITSSTNALGGVTETLFNQAGRPFARTNADGSTNGWRYDLLGRVIAEFQPNGSHWDTLYDDAHRTVTKLFVDPGGSVLAGTTNLFDRRGNLVTNIDAAGAAFFTVYDGLDRVVMSGGPGTVAGVSTQRVSYTFYDAAGLWVTNQDSLGQRIISRLDALRRPVLTEIHDSFPNNGNALVWAESTVYGADHHSVLRVTGTTNGTVSGPLSHLQFVDSFGNDVLSFPLLPYNIFARSTYDAANRLVESVDEMNRATAFTYDGLGRPATTRLPDGALVGRSYNAEGGLTALTMPGGLTWSATYNAANQLLSEQLSNGAARNRQFTNIIAASGPLAGLVQARIDLGRAVTNSFIYDAFRRVATNRATRPDPGLAPSALVTSFLYDRRGLITNYSQSSGLNPPTVVARSYDAYGELTNELVTINGAAQSAFLQRWDAAGRRRQLALAGSADPFGTLEYGYQVDGRMTSVSQGGHVCSFGYEDSGLLWLRSNPWRAHQVFSRYSNGKAAWQGSFLGNNYVFDEQAGLWGDCRLFGYSAARAGNGAWGDTRYYNYNARGQLTDEGVGLATGAMATNQFAFDPDGLGFLTGAQLSGASSNRWQATAMSGLGQVTEESWNEYGLKLRANGSAANAMNVALTLDGGAIGAVTNGGLWHADLSLAPGPHTLAATAQYAAGQYSAAATSSFSVLGTNGATDYYDGAGNVVARVFPGNGAGGGGGGGGAATNTTQELTWDAAGRLVSLTQRDKAGNGFNWSAIYDALGRRLRTVQTPVVSNVVNNAMTVTLDSLFDPEVEFQELAVSVNGERTWKLMGPDLDGEYGGLQGLGGLEATLRASDGQVTPVLNDYFGNVLATVAGTNASWNPIRVSGYGVVPGYRAAQFGKSTPLAEALVWRSRRIDPGGFYWLGARYYDPAAGRFLSPDPAGHDSSMDLYAFADGDPINQFDADGRFVSGAGNGAGQWASETYAGLGNSLDFILQPLARWAGGAAYAETHFGGGYEADPGYARNFEQGSGAYQLGHLAGYVGAELGFQVGLGVAAEGIGMLGRAAVEEGAGAGAAAEAFEAGELARAETGAARAGAGIFRAEAGAGALREEAALLRTEGSWLGGNVARAESFASSSRAQSGFGLERAESGLALTGSGASAGAGAGSPLTPGAAFAGDNLGGGRLGALKFDSPKSLKALELVLSKRGMAYGFIKGDKVTLIRLPPAKNLGHKYLIESGAVNFTPDMRAFSVLNYMGRGLKIFPWSEYNPENAPNLSDKHIRELKKLLGRIAGREVERL